MVPRSFPIAKLLSIGLFALLLTLPCVRTAQAQEPETAAQWNAKGKNWYDQREFQKALTCFKKAWSLEPGARYLFNSAKACVRLEEREGAIYYYRQYLSIAPDTADRDDVEQEMMELTRQMLEFGHTEVQFSSVPAGASIALDPPRPTEVVKTPGALFLKTGRYKVTLTLEGFEAAEVELEIPIQGPSPIIRKETLKPIPLTGDVEVELSPPGATLRVDGKEVTPGSHGKLSLKPGKHEFLATMAAHTPARTSVQVEAGKTTRVGLHLSPVHKEAMLLPNPWRTVALVAAGTGAAVALTGVVLYGVGSDQMSTANSNYDNTVTGYPGYTSDYSKGRDMAQWGLGLAIGGTVAAGGSMLLWWLLPETTPGSPTVSLAPGDSGGWMLTLSLGL